MTKALIDDINITAMLDALDKIGDHLCCYAGGTWPNDRFCDCKFGGPGDRGGELTGCPELRTIRKVIANLTAAEVETVVKRMMTRRW